MFKCEYGIMKIEKNSKLLMIGGRRKSLYYLDADVVINNSLNAVKVYSGESEIWHSRLGHLSESRLQSLQKLGKLKGSEKFKLRTCESCIQGKSSKLP